MQKNIDRALDELEWKVKTRNGSYVHATMQSFFWRFIDDFEVNLDGGNKLVEFRSSSRVGFSDLGVNRVRVEKFRGKIKEFE